MNKKGFTLIELLAVIVILSIIALIATPIVLNIINDAKEQSGLRSAEFYLDAVELSIAQSTLKGVSVIDGEHNIIDGKLCLNETCTETLPVEVKGDVPKSGTITIQNGQIYSVDFMLDEKRIITNSESEIIYFPCKLISGEANTIGSKYECEVKEGKKYNFYVLSYNDGNNMSTNDKTQAITTNLIMDQNINSDGTEAGMTGVSKNGDNVYNLVEWYSESQTNAKGPVDAMEFLYNATKSWKNIEPLNYTYRDKEIQGTTIENTSYISFISNNGESTITPLTGEATKIGTKQEPLRARMPIYSSDTTKTEVSTKTDNNKYLYENLNSNSNLVPYGYWTLSSFNTDWIPSKIVIGDGIVGTKDVLEKHGIRPVITLKF